MDENTERDVLVHVLLPTLVMELDSGLRDADAMDAKTGGALALAFAAIGLVVTVHQSLNALWVVPVIVLGVSASFLLVGIWPRSFQLGPHGLAFYNQARYARRTTVMAAQQMVGDLAESIDFNGSIQQQKARLFRFGFVLLLVGLVGCVLVAGFRPGNQKGATGHVKAQVILGNG